MEKSCRCRELFLSVFRSVQAIKLFKESVCKNFSTPVHQFVDSPTHSFFEQGDITFAAQPSSSHQYLYCSQQGLGDNDVVDGGSIDDDFTFLDALGPVDSATYFPPPLVTEISDSGMYRTNLELTPNIHHQYQLPINSTTAGTISNLELGFHEPEESFYETVEDPSHHFIEGTYSENLSANLPLLRQPAAMYGTDNETVSTAFFPSPQHYNEGLATLSCTSLNGSPTFNMTDSMNISLLDHQSLTNFHWPTIDYTAPHEFDLVEGDYFQRAQLLQYNCYYMIPQVPPTQARRILGCCVIANIVWMCKTFLSRIRSRMDLKRRYYLKVDDDYDGVWQRPSKSRRRNNWVAESRMSRFENGKDAGKVWFGSFHTKEQAARAHDVGTMFCCRKSAKGFNFPASQGILSILKDVIRNLALPEKKKAIKEVGKEYAKTGCIDECTRRYCSQTSNQSQLNSGAWSRY